jgi:hypothetical protein
MRMLRLSAALLTPALLCCAGTIPAQATSSGSPISNYRINAEVQNVGWSSGYGYGGGYYGRRWNGYYGDNYYRPRYYHRRAYSGSYYDDDCYY